MKKTDFVKQQKLLFWIIDSSLLVLFLANILEPQLQFYCQLIIHQEND